MVKKCLHRNKEFIFLGFLHLLLGGFLVTLTEKQQGFLDYNGHAVVIGGPGSGKTTVSSLKAIRFASVYLAIEQKVLFLSFARATVERISNAVTQEIDNNHQLAKKIEISTYHSFFWRIVKANGYLLGLPRRLSILSPPAEAVALSFLRKSKKTNINEKAIEIEKMRLASVDGLVCFDMLSKYAYDLLGNSIKLRQLISYTYPLIILDEFQDTNEQQWRVIKELGKNSVLNSLADPEQRIYDFIGASPERLNHFKEAFSPMEFNFGQENYRSSYMEIVDFGNDILNGKFKKSSYRGVKILKYPSNKNQAFSKLKYQIIESKNRLRSKGVAGWSIAILVPTKKLVYSISRILNTEQRNIKKISHKAVIETEGISLAMEIMAFLLQPKAETNDLDKFVNIICNFFKGRGGDAPTNSDISKAENIMKAYREYISCLENKNNPRKNSIILPLINTYNNCRNIIFIGNIEEDWSVLLLSLKNSCCKISQKIAEELEHIMLLNYGVELKRSLSNEWRNKGCYNYALEIMRNFFIKESILAPLQAQAGIIVMNMHKAKGRQFDEVIIFEGWPLKSGGKVIANPDRIVNSNSIQRATEETKQNFRVSITRARLCTTIMTPENDPCVLLPRS